MPECLYNHALAFFFASIITCELFYFHSYTCIVRSYKPHIVMSNKLHVNILNDNINFAIPPNFATFAAANFIFPL